MRTLVLAWLFLAGLAVSAFAQDIPAPRGFVTDESGMMTAQDRLGLEQRLDAFKQRTRVEVVVVLIPKLGGIPLEQYMARIWAAWPVGWDGAGVIFLYSPGDGQARIEFARNLRGRLSDADCDDIIRSHLVPEAEKGRVSSGVVRAADELVRRIEAGAARWAAAHPPRIPAEEEGDSLGSVLCVGLVLIGIVVVFLLSRGGGKGAKRGRR